MLEKYLSNVPNLDKSLQNIHSSNWLNVFQIL